MSIPVNANAVQERIDEVLARAAADPALEHSLRMDPEAALRSAGVALPPGVTLLVKPSSQGVPHVTVRLSGNA